jgi:hypothetical protein
MFSLMRKSAAVPVALLSAIAAGSVSAKTAGAPDSGVVSVAPAALKRGGFGETFERYWPIAGAIGAVFVIIYFSGGE